MSVGIRGAFVAVLFALVLAAVPATAQEPPAAPGREGRTQRVDGERDPVEARVFEVRFKSLAMAAELVGEVLSDDGTVTLQPRIRRLLVRDRRSILRQVQTLLQSFDEPPRSVDVTLSLFLGSRDEDKAAQRPNAGGSEFSREVRGVVETLPKITQWTQYQPLGSRAVTGVEGSEVVASVTGDYRVAFTVASVHDTSGGTLIKFERFSLQREVPLGDGGMSVEDLYTAGMVVDAGKLTLVVAASAPDSKRALFLALQAEPR